MPASKPHETRSDNAAPAPPEVAAECFGAALPSAAAYAGLLAGAGVVRGLIGPREVDRLWDRHLLNCAAVAELVPVGATVCDLGSGAGLPGVPLALARPDLTVILLEPLLRRATFLTECVAELGLERVSVLRARAEDQSGLLAVDMVTARAVAPLDRLATWALPLLRPGGELLALKGSGADQEVASARPVLDRLGAVECSVLHVGAHIVDPPATVVRVRIGESVARPRSGEVSARRAPGSSRSKRRR